MSVARRISTAFALFATLLASSCAEPENDPPPAIDSGREPVGSRRLVRSADGAEKVSAIPVNPVAASSGKTVVLSEPLVVRKAGLLLVVAEFQVTNRIDANIFVGSQVVLARGPKDVTGRPVTEASGQNVTPDMHHGQQTRTGLFEATSADEGRRYVNLVVWAASSGATSKAGLVVDRGYCRLSVAAV